MQSGGTDNNFQLFITQDTGRTYSDISVGIGSRPTGDIASAGGLLYAAPHNRSTDLGMTWEDLTERDTFGSGKDLVVFRTPSEGFFADTDFNGFAATTQDSGVSFLEQRTREFGLANLRRIRFRDSLTGWASTDGGFLRYTTDTLQRFVAGIDTRGGTSSVTDREARRPLSVYPNPVYAGTELTLGSEVTGLLTLSTITGQVLAQAVVLNQGVRIPASCPAGLYILRTSGGLSAKLVVR